MIDTSIFTPCFRCSVVNDKFSKVDAPKKLTDQQIAEEKYNLLKREKVEII
jgi:hypothetical protein